MTDEELRQLQEDAGWLDELIAQPGWNVLLRHARDKQLKEQTAIVQGRCIDYLDYQKRVAFTDGMEFLTSLPGKVIERMEEAFAKKIGATSDTDTSSR